MTTTANVAYFVVPLGMISPGWRGQTWPYGKKNIYNVDEFKPGKKKSDLLSYGQVGMIHLKKKG